jgi:hypothetical protein
MTYVVGILFLGVRPDGSMLERRDKVEFPNAPEILFNASQSQWRDSRVDHERTQT